MPAAMIRCKGPQAQAAPLADRRRSMPRRATPTHRDHGQTSASVPEHTLHHHPSRAPPFPRPPPAVLPRSMACSAPCPGQRAARPTACSRAASNGGGSGGSGRRARRWRLCAQDTHAPAGREKAGAVVHVALHCTRASPPLQVTFLRPSTRAFLGYRAPESCHCTFPLGNRTTSLPPLLLLGPSPGSWEPARLTTRQLHTTQGPDATRPHAPTALVAYVGKHAAPRHS